MQVFFCKYNDPSYVKMEKLDIMTRLASERNIDQVWWAGRCRVPPRALLLGVLAVERGGCPTVVISGSSF